MLSHAVALLAPAFLFFILLAGAALWAERLKRRGGAEASGSSFAAEYFLGSRSLQGVVLAMSLIATYGSVSSFVSGPGVAWQLGLGWVVFASPQIITGFFILGVIGKKIALVSRRTGSITVVDLIRARFESPLLANLCAVALLVFFTAMMMGQFVGGAAIFAGAAGIDPVAGLALFGLLVVFYTAFGGYRAVAWTDAVCAVLMLAGMAMLGVSILESAGGLEAAMAKAAAAGLPAPDAPLSASTALSPTAGGALPLSLLFSAWILVGFGTAGLPQSAVRCMSYRTTKDLHLAMVVSTIVCGILMIGLTTLGVLARGVEGLSPGGSTDLLIPKLIGEHMPSWAAGITLVGPLAATMSTVSSLLIAASSAIVKDLLLSAKPELAGNERALRRISRGATLLLGLLAMAFAVNPPTIVAWINLAAFGGLELAFLLPLAFGLFWRRANAAGAIASVIGGLAVYFWLTIAKLPLMGFHPVVPAFVAAALLFILGAYVGKPSSSRAMLDFFGGER